MWTFESKNIGVAVRRRRSDVLLVSFSHMDFPHHAGNFWCEAAAEKLGYAAVGLVCKTNCWYPAAEMLSLAENIRNFAQEYKTVLLYGHSMGGYAAVKYSALLRSNCAIAVSPQFSINPRDLYSPEGRLLDGSLLHHYKPELNADMAIAGPDIAGSVYLVFDPNAKVDAWHCAQIAERSNPRNCKIIEVRGYNLDHCAVDVFAATERFSQFVRLCAEDDAQAFQQAFASYRRTSDRRVFNTLKALLRRDAGRARRLGAVWAPRLHEYWRNKVEELFANQGELAL